MRRKNECLRQREGRRRTAGRGRQLFRRMQCKRSGSRDGVVLLREADGGKDVEAERFQSSGRLEIHGLLNAEQVEIYVSGGSEIADIGGGMIQTKKDRGWHGFGFSFGSGQNCLRVRTIEGDRVELEATQAAVVRGKVVRIGKDCEIDRVEYSDELILDGGSVREQVRV